MEYSKNNMYTQASAMKQNGWKVVGAGQCTSMSPTSGSQAANIQTRNNAMPQQPPMGAITQPVQPMSMQPQAPAPFPGRPLVGKSATTNPPVAILPPCAPEGVRLPMTMTPPQTPRGGGISQVWNMPPSPSVPPINWNGHNQWDDVSSNQPCGFCVTPAMAYIPNQTWTTTYPVEEAFKIGTIFPELNLPFTGGRK